MAGEKESLGELERQLLQYVAESGPTSVGAAAAHFASTSGQARTTILTVMERLRTKGYLRRRKVAGVYQYAAKESGSELAQRLLGDFVDRVLGGAVTPLVAYLNHSQGLKADEVAQLKRLVADLERQQREDKP